MKSILLVDDDKSITEVLSFALKKEYKLFIANDGETAMTNLKNNDIDVVLLDLKLRNENGMDLFQKMREYDKNILVIMITAYGTIKSSIEAIKSGIFQYMTKPIDIVELKFNIEKAAQTRALYNKIDVLEKENKKMYQNIGIISNSTSMQNILKIVDKIKDIDSNVLITGESGTGKGVIAKAIHNLGNRTEKRFNVLNCSAIPKDLLESELFGHVKGAFTGAIKDKKGYFALSNGGTLLLDEIGDMDLKLQSKLLNVIQEKKVMPLGSEKEISLDVRIIAATNKDLKSMIKNEEFREDLFYRLNVINLYMPPLRERKEDIDPLINHFIDKYSCELSKDIIGVEDSFISALEKHDFCGNIRELENIIERAIALTDSKVLRVEDIHYSLESNINVNEKLNLRIPVFLGDTLEEVEKKVIEVTYKECNYNQKETAKILGITDRTIRNKLKKYNQ